MIQKIGRKTINFRDYQCEKTKIGIDETQESKSKSRASSCFYTKLSSFKKLKTLRRNFVLQRGKLGHGKNKKFEKKI